MLDKLHMSQIWSSSTSENLAKFHQNPNLFLVHLKSKLIQNSPELKPNLNSIQIYVRQVLYESKL